MREIAAENRKDHREICGRLWETTKLGEMQQREWVRMRAGREVVATERAQGESKGAGEVKESARSSESESERE